MAIEDKFEDDIQKLMDQGKEKGYLTYGEVNDLLPDNMHSADDLDDLITTINTQGIDLLEGEPKFAGEKFDAEHAEEGDDVELDLTPGTLEKTNDPGTPKVPDRLSDSPQKKNFPTSCTARPGVGSPL